MTTFVMLAMDAASAVVVNGSASPSTATAAEPSAGQGGAAAGATSSGSPASATVSGIDSVGHSRVVPAYAPARTSAPRIGSTTGARDFRGRRASRSGAFLPLPGGTVSVPRVSARTHPSAGRRSFEASASPPFSSCSSASSVVTPPTVARRVVILRARPRESGEPG